ncbi:MAG TPA: hypothetical protein VLT33_03840, partial [Labilithrix sp.]|nr:hypothetical protein [Labilithrix sp.]
VRAVMLACLLERPPGLDEKVLHDELVDLVLRYLVEDVAAVAPPAQRRPIQQRRASDKRR